MGAWDPRPIGTPCARWPTTATSEHSTGWPTWPMRVTTSAELSELLDEGSMRAGELLTRRAVEAGDLLELQRVSDAGYDRAGVELNRLLAGPAE